MGTVSAVTHCSVGNLGFCILQLSIWNGCTFRGIHNGIHVGCHSHWLENNLCIFPVGPVPVATFCFGMHVVFRMDSGENGSCLPTMLQALFHLVATSVFNMGGGSCSSCCFFCSEGILSFFLVNNIALSATASDYFFTYYPVWFDTSLEFGAQHCQSSGRNGICEHFIKSESKSLRILY